MKFLNALINGISLGSIYAIIAIGYTMVYGIAKMLNFAHGDVIMIGGYVAYFAIVSNGMDPVLGFLLTMIFTTLLGVVVEKLAYSPLRSAPSLAVLITAIGVSYFLQNIVLLIFGSTPKMFSGISLPNLSLMGGKLTVSGVTILTIVVSVLIVVSLVFFINKTKIGKSMLAVSEDRDAAKLMGINVNFTISVTFAIGSALAAIATFLYFSAYPSVTNTAGAMPGIKAFIAAVFGGIGSIPGAMVGGILLGIIEILSATYISTNLSLAIVFGILIVLIIIKPTGIFGKKIKEKV